MLRKASMRHTGSDKVTMMAVEREVGVGGRSLMWELKGGTRTRVGMEFRVGQLPLTTVS